MDTLFDALLKYFPLPPGAPAHSTQSIPPSRVTLVRSDAVANKSSVDLLLRDEKYCLGKVKCNERITSRDWYQDVRHLEFEFDEEIQLSITISNLVPNRTNLAARYSPGDVAAIHPIADSEDVDAFLKLSPWSKHVDNHYEIQHTMTGK
jgi:sulfite reductase alpha subunit-like flavoprotein